MTKGAMYGVITLLVFVLIGMNYLIGQSMSPGAQAAHDHGGAKQIDAGDVKAVEDVEKRLGGTGSQEPGHEGHDHGPQPNAATAEQPGHEGHDHSSQPGAGVQEQPGHEGHDHGPQPGAKGASAAGAGQAGGGPVVKAGNPDAKVKVEAFVVTSAECHQKTVDLLKKVSGSDPDRVYVEVYDMSGAGSKMAEKGVSCATVFVNNKSQYTIDQSGKTRAIDMSKKPNDPGSTYNSEDVPLVIDQELKAAYGKGLKSVPKG